MVTGESGRSPPRRFTELLSISGAAPDEVSEDRGGSGRVGVL